MSSSSDPKTENATESKPLMNEPPSEKLGDSSPELGDSNSSEKLGDSSTVWKDPVESSRSPNEEEKGECSFCVYMKDGGCRESFTAWEVCMEGSEKYKKEDIVTKCEEVNDKLFECMYAHFDYYKRFLPEMNKEEEISQEELAARKQAQG